VLSSSRRGKNIVLNPDRYRRGHPAGEGKGDEILEKVRLSGESWQLLLIGLVQYVESLVSLRPRGKICSGRTTTKGARLHNSQ